MSPSRLRVLAVINALGEGGTERSLADLVEALPAQGVDVTIAALRTRGHEGVEYRLRERGHRIILLPGGPQRIRALRRLIRDERPAVVHSMLFEANQVARVASTWIDVPLLTSLVNTSYAPERVATSGVSRSRLRLVRTIDTVSGRLCVDHFHAVSQAVRTDAVEHLHVPPHRVTVVPRGRIDPRPRVDTGAGARVRAELGIDLDATVALHVGRQEFQKAQPTIVAATGALLEARSDLWLLIAGREGNATAALEQAVRRLPDPERVLVLGHRGDIAEIMAASDLLIAASTYEGMPGAIIEAMAMSLPVIASDIPPVREVVEPGTTALLAPVGDVAAFTGRLQELVDDPDRRAALGAYGRGRFESSFTIERAAEGMAELYRLLAAGVRSTAS